MTITDQLGTRLRRINGSVTQTLAKLMPGGHQQRGLGSPLLSGKTAPKVPVVRLALASNVKAMLPSPITSPTRGMMVAPHPTGQATASVLGRGFRSIRSNVATIGPNPTGQIVWKYGANSGKIPK